MTDILMPALSPTMEEGKLAKWLVNEGDTVKPGDVIAEIETDKATMEVEAVDEGVISKLVIPAGTEGVKVNSLIAVLKGEGEAAPKSNGKAVKVEAPKAEAEALVEQRRGTMDIVCVRRNRRSRLRRVCTIPRCLKA